MFVLAFSGVRNGDLNGLCSVLVASFSRRRLACGVDMAAALQTLTANAEKKVDHRYDGGWCGVLVDDACVGNRKKRSVLPTRTPTRQANASSREFWDSRKARPGFRLSPSLMQHSNHRGQSISHTYGLSIVSILVSNVYKILFIMHLQFDGDIIPIQGHRNSSYCSNVAREDSHGRHHPHVERRHSQVDHACQQIC